MHINSSTSLCDPDQLSRLVARLNDEVTRWDRPLCSLSTVMLGDVRSRYVGALWRDFSSSNRNAPFSVNSSPYGSNLRMTTVRAICDKTTDYLRRRLHRPEGGVHGGVAWFLNTMQHLVNTFHQLEVNPFPRDISTHFANFEPMCHEATKSVMCDPSIFRAVALRAQRSSLSYSVYDKAPFAVLDRSLYPNYYSQRPWLNRHFTQVFGYNSDEMTDLLSARAALRFTHPVSHEDAFHTFACVMFNRLSETTYDRVIITKSGRPLCVRGSERVTFTASGVPIWHTIFFQVHDVQPDEADLAGWARAHSAFPNLSSNTVTESRTRTRTQSAAAAAANDTVSHNDGRLSAASIHVASVASTASGSSGSE
jgi:hypothetical protein